VLHEKKQKNNSYNHRCRQLC